MPNFRATLILEFEADDKADAVATLEAIKEGGLGVPVCRTMRHQPYLVHRTNHLAAVTCGRCLRSLRTRPWVDGWAEVFGKSAPGPADPGAGQDTMRARARGTEPEPGQATPGPHGLATP